MPGDAGAGGDGAKLVDDVPRDEVDVVVAETQLGVADALATQLVQLGFLHPLPALWGSVCVWVWVCVWGLKASTSCIFSYLVLYSTPREIPGCSVILKFCIIVHSTPQNFAGKKFS